MKIEYDPDADAAYIRLKEEIGIGGVSRSYPLDPDEVGGMIVLDFDADDRLIGIEVLDASRHLPLEALPVKKGEQRIPPSH